MTKKSINIEYEEFDNYESLSDETQELIKAAVAFSANAYAPYSQFRVSAVARLEDGKLVKGTNVENASYPISICAERTLLSHVISNYPGQKIKEIAIFVDKDLSEPVSPCGMCRQALLETEKNQETPIRLYLISQNKKVVVFEKCATLLPLSFDGAVL